METNDETPTTEQPAPAAEAAPPDPPKLMRSSDDRLIAGVCGGIAERYGVDVGFVRILAVILALIGGVTIFAYLAAVLLLPQNDGQGNPIERVEYRRIAQVAGFAAIGVAVLMLVSNGIGADSAIFWPSFGGAVACLAVIAVAIAVGRRLRTPAPGATAAPTLGRVAGIVLLVAAACVGAVVLAGLSALMTMVSGAVPAAIVVLVIGVVMVGLSASRRPALWLVVPALAVAAPATLLASADVRVDGSVGERRYTPATHQDIAGDYELGVGQLVIDLRNVDLTEYTTLRLRLGIGEARVIVPKGTCVQTDNHIRVGEERILGSSWSGASLQEPRGDISQAREIEGALAGAPKKVRDQFGPPTPTLAIEADIQAGQLVVTDGTGLPGFETDSDVGDSISPALADLGCAGRRGR